MNNLILTSLFLPSLALAALPGINAIENGDFSDGLTLPAQAGSESSRVRPVRALLFMKLIVVRWLEAIFTRITYALVSVRSKLEEQKWNK